MAAHQKKWREELGNTEFLVSGKNPSGPSNLPSAISDLEEASAVFMMRWQQQDYQRAGLVTEKALQLFDFISNQILRRKVERKGLGNYNGSPFEAQMAVSCGSGVTATSFAEQNNMVTAGAGNGNIVIGARTQIQLTMDRLLNKIKHRNGLMNFREVNGHHIFVICTDHTTGGPEGIYEFDVVDFCAQCKLISPVL